MEMILTFQHSFSRATIKLFYIFIIKNFGKSVQQLYHCLKLVPLQETKFYLTRRENTSFLAYV